MADLADVEQALVDIVSGVLYPAGTGNPSAVGAPVEIYRGWPAKKKLDADLAAGKLTVTVFSRPAERNTTRFPREWQQQTAPVHTITASVALNVITLGGSPAAGQWVAAIIGGVPFSYGVLANDTLDDIASKLTMLIAAKFSATAAGATITINSGLSVVARIGAPGTSAMEIRRQLRQFQITFWCATPAGRDQAAGLVDPVLADTDFLTLPDGFAGRLLYVSTAINDGAQSQNLYRRDLIYSVEYPTTVSATDYEITSITEGIQGSGSPPDAPIINAGI